MTPVPAPAGSSGGGRVWPVAALLAALVVLGAAVVARWSPVVDLDHGLATWAFDLARVRPRLASIALTVQSLFSTTPTAFATLVVVLLAVRGHRREGVVVVAVMATTSVLTGALKLAVDRPRPRWSDPLATLASPSFPSGHASSTTAAATLAVLLGLALLSSPAARRAVVVLAAVVVLGVGADRVLLGVHYLSDVVAGGLLGAAVAVGLWRLTGAGSPADVPQPRGSSGPSSPSRGAPRA